MRSALYNSNTCIGYKLAFYRYRFDLDMYTNCTSGRKLINGHNLSYDKLAIVSNLSTLNDIRAGNFYIDGLTINDIDILIEGIATLYLGLCIIIYLFNYYYIYICFLLIKLYTMSVCNKPYIYIYIIKFIAIETE